MDLATMLGVIGPIKIFSIAMLVEHEDVELVASEDLRMLEVD